MRAAIFFGAVLIAKAIDGNITSNQVGFLATAITVFMIADLIELIKKLTK